MSANSSRMKAPPTPKTKARTSRPVSPESEGDVDHAAREDDHDADDHVVHVDVADPPCAPAVAALQPGVEADAGERQERGAEQDDQRLPAGEAVAVDLDRVDQDVLRGGAGAQGRACYEATAAAVEGDRVESLVTPRGRGGTGPRRYCRARARPRTPGGQLARRPPRLPRPRGARAGARGADGARRRRRADRRRPVLARSPDAVVSAEAAPHERDRRASTCPSGSTTSIWTKLLDLWTYPCSLLISGLVVAYAAVALWRREGPARGARAGRALADRKRGSR